jgi:hypothetical protein
MGAAIAAPPPCPVPLPAPSVKSGRDLLIRTAPVFRPLLQPSPYKGAHGGRSSGKSHFFGELAVDDGLAFPGNHGEGLRMVCLREVQKDLAQSSKRLIEDKLNRLKLGPADGFKVFRDAIETPKDGLIIFKGMNDYTAESIKSLEGFNARGSTKRKRFRPARCPCFALPFTGGTTPRFGQAGTRRVNPTRSTISFAATRKTRPISGKKANGSRRLA